MYPCSNTILNCLNVFVNLPLYITLYINQLEYMEHLESFLFSYGGVYLGLGQLHQFIHEFNPKRYWFKRIKIIYKINLKYPLHMINQIPFNIQYFQSVFIPLFKFKRKCLNAIIISRINYLQIRASLISCKSILNKILEVQ